MNVPGCDRYNENATVLKSLPYADACKPGELDLEADVRFV